MIQQVNQFPTTTGVAHNTCLNFFFFNYSIIILGLRYNGFYTNFKLKCNINFSEEGLPTFRRNRQTRFSNESYKLSIDYDLSIHVEFPDHSTDVLVVKMVPGEETVFQGRLWKEKTAVSVIIQNASNPDVIEVEAI